MRHMPLNLTEKNFGTWFSLSLIISLCSISNKIKHIVGL